jgi:hypothetical protein
MYRLMLFKPNKSIDLNYPILIVYWNGFMHTLKDSYSKQAQVSIKSHMKLTA